MGWKNRPLGRSGMPPPCVVRGKDKAAARPGTKIMRRSRRLVFRWRWSRPVRGVRRAAAAFGRTPPSNARRAARKTCAARLFRDRDVAASVAGESRAFGPANLWPTRPRPACARWSPSRERKPGSESVPAPRPAPHGFAVSAVRAGGPCLVPSRGGARKWALPFLFPFIQIESALGGLGLTSREPGPPPLDILQRRSCVARRLGRQVRRVSPLALASGRRAFSGQ
jgi:hypothetical protein